MAFRKFRKFGGRRQWRKQKGLWTAQTTTVACAAGAISTTNLVLGSDAELTTLVSGRLRVDRLVGSVHLTSSGNAAWSYGLGIAHMSAFLVPAAGGFADPTVTQQLIERDWLRMMNGAAQANQLANGLVERHVFDIRVSRNLKEDDAIRCIVRNLGADAIVIDIDIRIRIVVRV